MVAKKYLLMIVEDEEQIRSMLKSSLESAGYNTEESGTIKGGIQKIEALSPDLIILDLQLPDGSGLDLVKQIRIRSDIPILILSVLNSDSDKIHLLDSGADDYITKPFSIAELQARIRNCLRHSRANTFGIFKTGDLSIDFTKRIVTLSNKEVHLTPIEYSFLSLLAEKPGHVITHEQILRKIWGPTPTNETNSLRVHVTQLRKKIEKNPLSPEFVITEPGVGYRLSVKND